MNPPDESKFPPFRLELCILTVVLILAAFLRFYRADGYGLWSDEFVTLMLASKSSWLDLARTCFRIPQPVPPLYFLAEKLVVDLRGVDEVSLRLVSVLASLATVGLAYAIARKLCGFEVALTGALLLAVNSTQIVYAQNARPYAFCLMLSCTSVLFLTNWLRTGRLLPKLGFVVSTVLLLYSHYVFALLLIVQNLYVWWWIRRMRLISGHQERPPSVGWKTWLRLQVLVAACLLPLLPQLWNAVASRQVLNWASGQAAYVLRVENLFFFLPPTWLFLSAAVTLTLAAIALYWKGAGERSWQAKPVSGNGLILFAVWYLTPLIVCLLITLLGDVHVFVERYLLLASVPAAMIVPATAFYLVDRKWARLFLGTYLMIYVISEPTRFWQQKGLFSQGVPGGNEWRETMRQLGRPDFAGPLLLFQSPFIESNQLDFDSSPERFDYLASPLRSFYLREYRPRFCMLPVHWWIEDPKHRQFKQELKKRIKLEGELVLLSTAEFWSHFEAWLKEEFSGEVQVVGRFRSTGSLRLNRLKVTSDVPRLGSPVETD
ncbi:MAG: glycosyltransferase family 39 protein [Acidobacteriota bacterium]